MNIVNEVYQYLVQKAPQILMAIVVFAAGMVVVYFLNRLTKKALARSRIDQAIVRFIEPVVKIGLYIIVGIIALSVAGFPTTSLVAAFGAVGLAVSLAVKDSLANMASGLLLLASKPFKIGDVVEADGVTGTVKEISILYTQINTFDNRVVYIPNGQIADEQIINISREGERRLDLTFGISYKDDVERAKALIKSAVDAHKDALKTPEPIIRLCELGDSAVKISCYVWVESSNLINLKFDLLEQVKQLFDENGISIPYPQLDVHLDPTSQQPTNQTE